MLNMQPGNASDRDDPKALPCAVCGEPDRTPLHRVGPHTYGRCVRCGLVSLDAMPDSGAIESLYDREYFVGGTRAAGYLDYESDEEIHRRNARDRLRLIDEHTGLQGGHLLDVGCGLGFFADEARAVGWKTVGVDVSKYARSYVNDRFDLYAVGSIGEATAPDGGFDVVCLFQVLEHTAHPVHMLRELASIASKDAAFVVETWDRSSRLARLMGDRWHQLAPPAVTHLFDRRTLEAALLASDLELAWVGRTSKRVGLGHVLHTASSKLPRALRPPVSVPARWAGDLSFRYSLGDLITVVARARRPQA